MRQESLHNLISLCSVEEMRCMHARGFNADKNTKELVNYRAVDANDPSLSMSRRNFVLAKIVVHFNRCDLTRRLI